MTTYVVGYTLPRQKRVRVFEVETGDMGEAMDWCLAFFPGSAIVGVFPKEELRHIPWE